MNAFVQVNDEGYVTDIINYSVPGYVRAELPDVLPQGALGGWYRFEDGQLVYDRKRYEEINEIPLMQGAIDGLRGSFVSMSSIAAQVLPDEQALELLEAWPAWDEHWTGKRGDIVRDEDGLYRSIHDILVPEENTVRPAEDAAGQKWRSLGKPGEEWPAWSRPILPDDGYVLGDKVTHNGRRWVCTQVGGDGRNVWEPGVYGWDEAQ